MSLINSKVTAIKQFSQLNSGDHVYLYTNQIGCIADMTFSKYIVKCVEIKEFCTDISLIPIDTCIPVTFSCMDSNKYTRCLVDLSSNQYHLFSTYQLSTEEIQEKLRDELD